MAKIRRALDIDTRKIIVATIGLSLKDIGSEWLRLMAGGDSAFSSAVARDRMCVEGRKSLPAKVRQQVFERDGNACVYCGSGEHLECDHVIAVKLGGGDNIENLAAACKPCNLSKRDLPLWQWEGRADVL